MKALHEEVQKTLKIDIWTIAFKRFKRKSKKFCYSNDDELFGKVQA